MKKADIKELIKDPYWRINNLYRIVDKQANKIQFVQNGIQRKIQECDSKYKIILKARQFGVTTGECVRLFDKTIFNRNTTTAIIAHEKDAIEKIFRIVKKCYRFMHPDLKPAIDKGGGSKYQMYFPEINSMIYCDLESRGDTIHHLHVSEAAFANPDRINATMDAVPIDGYVTWESTPFGFGNHFHEKWVHSKKFAKLFFPWYMHHEYQIHVTEPLIRTQEEVELAAYALAKHDVAITDHQIMFRREKIDTKGDLSFRQEYPENDVDCFLFSGQPAMRAHVVKELLDKAPEPMEYFGRGKAEIYHKRHPKKTYVCGVDTASGVGEDSCVAVIFDRETMEEQACLAGKWEPFEFANLVAELCGEYAKGAFWPFLVVESNNHGHAVLLQLIHHIHYPNLYYHKGNMEKPGWITDSVSRPRMINTFIDAVHNDHATINSKETLKECLALIDNKGKIEATDGFHDDRVMAAAIAITIIAEQKPTQKIYENVRQSILI